MAPQVDLKSTRPTLGIGDVARAVGLRTSAVRYYEAVGVLPAPPRRHGRRVYGPDDVERLRVVQFAQNAGFTLDEIRVLFHGFGEQVPPAVRWQEVAHRKLRELDERLESITRMRAAVAATLSCGCVRLEDCASASVRSQDV